MAEKRAEILGPTCTWKFPNNVRVQNFKVEVNKNTSNKYLNLVSQNLLELCQLLMRAECEEAESMEGNLPPTPPPSTSTSSSNNHYNNIKMEEATPITLDPRSRHLNKKSFEDSSSNSSMEVIINGDSNSSSSSMSDTMWAAEN
jgi:hypothetical protein